MTTYQQLRPFIIFNSHKPPPPGGVLPEKLGGGVLPVSQNPYPIYDQILRNSLPFLWPYQNFETLFMTDPYIKILFQTCVIIKSLVQTNVKLP